MGFLSFLSKPKTKRPIPTKPEFHFIDGGYIYDSNDFEVLAYAKFYNTEVRYILKHKKNGTFFSYEDGLTKKNEPYELVQKLQRLTISGAMVEYNQFKTFPKQYYPERYFLKSYEEAFGIQLSHYGDEPDIKIKEPESKGSPVTAEPEDFLEIV